MNTQLVDSLVKIIHSLSEEERALLEEKLKKPDWPTIRQRIVERGVRIDAYRQGKPLDPPPEEIIRQMREERDEQLMRACFPQFYSDES